MANVSGGNTAAAVSGETGGMKFPLFIMTSLFFIWGFITVLNDILIPHLKSAFDLNYTQTMLIQFCFFGAYFLVSVPAGTLIKKVGYRGGIIVGLLVGAVGCVMFYPAASLKIYPLFLAALFVLASGMTILQVSANPYVAALGPEATAASRLNLAQALNSLGTTIAPIFGAYLIISAVDTPADATSVQLPYLILASALLVTAGMFFFLKLPAMTHLKEAAPGQETTYESAWMARHLVLGALAVFFYVGAEVSIGSFLVNFISESHIGDMPEARAAEYISLYWGGAMVGRFAGSAITRVIEPAKVLFIAATLAAGFVALTMVVDGKMAMWTILSVGLFNSIMFPTIFGLAIKGLGAHTSQGSSLLCLSIVGGAIIPLVQGVAADLMAIQASFIVPVVCYLYIMYYGLKGSEVQA